MIVTACATVANDTEKPSVNLAGYPPSFRDGYTDGCNTARRHSAAKKDEDRYKSDSMYAAGWRDGHDICSGKTYD